MTIIDFARQLEQFGVVFTKITHELLGEVKPSGITFLQFEILHQIYSEERVTLSQISNCVGMSLPNTSREVKKLQDKGIVHKLADSLDKRIYYIMLTATGLDAMDTATRKLESIIAARFSHLAPDDVYQLSQALNLLSDKLIEKR